MTKVKTAHLVAYGELTTESSVGRSGLSYANHLDALPTTDLVTELLVRCTQTNGLHFCNLGDISSLQSLLMSHLIAAKTSELAAQQRAIVERIYREETEAKRSSAYATPRRARAKKERKPATTLTLKGFAELKDFVSATRVSF